MPTGVVQLANPHSTTQWVSLDQYASYGWSDAVRIQSSLILNTLSVNLNLDFLIFFHYLKVVNVTTFQIKI